MRGMLVGGVVAIAGLTLLVVSALADPIGIGEGSGVGWKQVTGMIVGGAMVAVGVLAALTRRRAVGGVEAATPATAPGKPDG